MKLRERTDVIGPWLWNVLFVCLSEELFKHDLRELWKVFETLVGCNGCRQSTSGFIGYCPGAFSSIASFEAVMHSKRQVIRLSNDRPAFVPTEWSKLRLSVACTLLVCDNEQELVRHLPPRLYCHVDERDVISEVVRKAKDASFTEVEIKRLEDEMWVGLRALGKILNCWTCHTAMNLLERMNMEAELKQLKWLIAIRYGNPEQDDSGCLHPAQNFRALVDDWRVRVVRQLDPHKDAVTSAMRGWTRVADNTGMRAVYELFGRVLCTPFYHIATQRGECGLH